MEIGNTLRSMKPVRASAAASVEPDVRQGRGRPSRAQAVVLEARILEVAWQTFLDVGFEGATMEMLAKRAGVARNTLYARHADKLALLRATVADRIVRWARESKTVSVPGDLADNNLEDRLVAFATTALVLSGNPEVLGTARLVRGSTGDVETIARELDRTIRQSGLDALDVMISQGCARAGRQVDDPMTVARLLIGMLEAFAPVDERAALTSERAEAIARRAVAVLLRGQEAW